MKRIIVLALLVVLIPRVAGAACDAAVGPRIDTASVRGPVDGETAFGASWRDWPVSQPTRLTASGPDNAVGLLRPGAAWAELSMDAGAPMALDRVLLVETSSADPSAPDGRAGLVAVQRTASPQRLSVLPPMSLVRLAAPRVSVAWDTAVVEIDPLVAGGAPLTAREGLAAWQVLRSAAGADAFEVVATVPAGSGASRFDDRALPSGAWDYAVRPVFSGGVVGLFGSPATQGVRAYRSECHEPSALDLSPSTVPLAVLRDGARLRVSWEPLPDVTFDVYRGTLAALRKGRNDLAPAGACALSESSALVVAGAADVLVVASRCGAGRSSLGRRSDGTERTAPAAGCP